MAAVVDHAQSTEAAAASTSQKYRCKAFYLNLLLLNKEEIVASKVTEKAGRGIFGKAAAFAANKLISDEKVVTGMAEKLIEGISKTILELGIEAEFNIKYQHGAFVVIRVQIVEVDTLTLILSAKGPDFATNFSTLLHTVEQLGMADVVTQRVNEKVYSTLTESMMSKFAEMIPKKMSDQGVAVECHPAVTDDQAEVFFDLLQRLNLHQP